jgi:hypothetical protein
MIDSLRATKHSGEKSLSKPVNDVERWRLFDETVNQVRKAVASIPASELNDTIEKAISTVRRQKQRKVRSHSPK